MRPLTSGNETRSGHSVGCAASVMHCYAPLRLARLGCTALLGAAIAAVPLLGIPPPISVHALTHAGAAEVSSTEEKPEVKIQLAYWLKVTAVDQSAPASSGSKPVDATSSKTFFFAASSSPAKKTRTGAARPRVPLKAAVQQRSCSKPSPFARGTSFGHSVLVIRSFCPLQPPGPLILLRLSPRPRHPARKSCRVYGPLRGWHRREGSGSRSQIT